MWGPYHGVVDGMDVSQHQGTLVIHYSIVPIPQYQPLGCQLTPLPVVRSGYSGVSPSHFESLARRRGPGMARGGRDTKV